MDETALERIGKWSLAGYRAIIRLPQVGPFSPFPLSRSTSAMRIQARVELDAAESCVRTLGVAGPKVRSASAVSSASGAKKLGKGTDSSSAPGCMGHKRSMRSPRTPAPKRPRSTATSSASHARREKDVADPRDTDHNLGPEERGPVNVTAHGARPELDSLPDATALEAAKAGQLGAAAQTDEESSCDGSEEGDDEIALGEEEGDESRFDDEDDDVFWRGGRELPSDFSDAIAMPKAKRGVHSDSHLSDSEPLSEGTVLDMFRRSGIQALFLHPDEMDALLAEEREESATKPVTEPGAL